MNYLNPEAIDALTKATTDPAADVRAGAMFALRNPHVTGKKPIAALAKALLSDTDLSNRVTAADSLAEIGPAAKDAVPALIKALRSEDRNTRISAAYALQKIGPAAESAVPALIEALKDDAIRVDAVSALGAIGPGAKQAVPALLAATKVDPMPKYVATFGRIGPGAKAAVPFLLERCGWRTPSTAVFALCQVEPDIKHVPLLVELVTSGKLRQSYSFEEAVVPTFRKIGKPVVPHLMKAFVQVKERYPITELLVAVGKPAVPALVEALPNKKVRDSVLDALAEIGPDAESAIPALFATMDDPDAKYRQYLLRTVTFIEPESPRMRSFLLKAFDDSAPQVRHTAVDEFVMSQPIDMKVLSENAFPMLLRDLDSADEGVRHGAAWTLGRTSEWVGSKSHGAILKALDHKEPSVRWTILANYDFHYFDWARSNPLLPIEKLPDPVLKKALKDEDASVRKEARRLLGLPKEEDAAPKAKPDKKTIVRQLLERLHDPRKEGWERITAAGELHKIDAERARTEAVPVLVDYMRDHFESSPHRMVAAQTLGQIGADTPTVRSLLLKTIRDKNAASHNFSGFISLGPTDMEVRLWAMYPLIKFKAPGHERWIKEIIRVLQDRESGNGWSSTAAQVLGKIGPQAKEAVPALLEALRDDWPELQWTAAQALNRVDPKAAAKAGVADVK